MPHFVIECSSNIVKLKEPQQIIQAVYDTAEATQLFTPGDIKVRIRSFDDYTVGNTTNDFIHVFAYIMEGRTQEQKKKLSKSVVQTLQSIFPEVPILSINIMDFEKATYLNKSQL
ncbi:5-carboxymethyl-2-hydroxymuconate Delta-isomerase [Aquimarina sp. 2-A2]|uniref:5-carboxymethyl-2-hydroxymuconate Delta-isomerase n=1 Tax=Aquimarina sp. 2-A2 TaxID=3382644 RepID=UPI00387F239A